MAGYVQGFGRPVCVRSRRCPVQPEVDYTCLKVYQYGSLEIRLFVQNGSLYMYIFACA